MHELKKTEKQNNPVLLHDINSSLSALQSAIDVIKDEWRSNPELVDKILPLAVDKIHELHLQLQNYRNNP
jgi:hypothetical protein